MQSASRMSENLYVVESIMGKKLVEGKLFYKVKWQGYPESESTWEKLAHLRYVSDMVKNYEMNITNETIDSASRETASPEASFNDKDTADTHDHPAQMLMSESSKNPQEEEPSLEKEEKEERKEKKKGKKKEEADRKEGKQLESSEKPPQDDPSSSRTRSQLKSLRKKEKQKMTEKEDQKKRLLKRDSKHLKKLNKGETLAKPTNAAVSGEKQVKAEEEEPQREEIKIRLIVAEGDSDIRDYVVEYLSGNARVLNTCQLFYAHPIEFVDYLERRAKAQKK